MSRFLFTTTTRIGSSTIRLRHKGLWLAEGDANKITDMLAQARQMLSSTITAVYNGAANEEFARTYFKTVPTAAEWKRIHANLELIFGGLNTDVTLKLGGDGADGYVRASVIWTGPGRCRLSHAGHTIHVSKKSILADAERGIKIIIHEASHKYANTEDYDVRGYRLVDDRDWVADGLTKAEALNNADSYAHFAYHQGASKGA